MIKTVLLTGASGFIGKAITRVLHDQGFRLLLLDQAFDSSFKSYCLKRSIDFYEQDLLTFNEPLEPDVVIHGAALTAEAKELKLSEELYLKTSLELNFHMIHWARTQQVRRFIFISSAGVFASHQQDVLNEASPGLNTSLYALAKRCTEDLVANLNKEYPDREYLSVRLGNVYGTEETPRASRPRVSLLQRMLNQALSEGRILVPQESNRDWTFASDIGQLFACLVKHPKPAQRLYHLVSGEQFSALELAQALKNHLPELKLEPESAAFTQLRAPLHSKHVQELPFSDWTSLDQGLGQVLNAQRQVLA